MDRRAPIAVAVFKVGARLDQAALDELEEVLFSADFGVETVEEVTGEKVPVEYGPRREGDPPALLADPTLAKDVLGWEARHKDVRDMVRTAWQWMSSPGKGRYKR